MADVIFDPLEEFDQKHRQTHLDRVNAFFEELVKKSGVDIEQNRNTVKQYKECNEDLSKMRKKLNWLRVLRVLMCITLVLIPVVILKTTPKIKALRANIEEADKRASELLNEAYRQMAPLNGAFTDRDALNLIESVMPLVKFADCFTASQEEDMKVNYDFTQPGEDEESTIDVLAGSYNDNPFLFENKRIHTMGTETYHGYKTITWTEHYVDSNGKSQTRTRSQTLHATVTKPKPFYNTRVILNYCAQGGPDLCFSRDASHLDRKSDKAIDRLVKSGEKKLQKKSERALSQNSDFTSMSNTEFEVLFDALDRDNELQFRALFTPLAQTNMVDLIRSRVGYGDDFAFIKTKRTNRIVTDHSQGRPINLVPADYFSYDYDVIRENFITKNVNFFKAVYFDFAPVLAIPAYQERPIQSLKPIPDYGQLYSLKECEVLANAVERKYVVHPNTKTEAIVKSTFVASRDNVDETCITAYSYDIEQRVDYVPVHGDDGYWHDVPVHWDLYLPLQASNHFFVAKSEDAKSNMVMAKHNGLCIFNS